ncbi:dCMP deaminase [Xanthomonas phage vB_Xar_IVIA-DoCa10]|uniref:dCMP deaminase n=1 Tax=Xanthomonas phage vB_Xar_IVIA-DoCa10 TaxID=2975529 RepID=A0A9X9JNF3_9CAUD|nr:dCMP deaminase [Xanthomonas phage vB_Xar_IVIA-DoCa10]UYA99042.1 dCMP deaminase [Xanthomonas phage vB_Xar_IVIA-DoCa10]
MEAPIKRTQEEWDEFFYGMAVLAASMSKDPDRKVGAVLVTPDRRQVSPGYNGFPPGVPDLPSLLADRDFKLANMVHAEDNCLRQAPFSPEGCTVYVTRFPCLTCASKLRLAGVHRIVAPKPDLGHARWGKSWAVSTAILTAAGILITYIAENHSCDCC